MARLFTCEKFRQRERNCVWSYMIKRQLSAIASRSQKRIAKKKVLNYVASLKPGEKKMSS